MEECREKEGREEEGMQRVWEERGRKKEIRMKGQ